MWAAYVSIVCRVSVGNTGILRAGEEKLLLASVDNSFYPTVLLEFLNPRRGSKTVTSYSWPEL